MYAIVKFPIPILDAECTPTRQREIQPGTHALLTIINPLYGIKGGNWYVLTEDHDPTRIGASVKWWRHHEALGNVEFA